MMSNYSQKASDVYSQIQTRAKSRRNVKTAYRPGMNSYRNVKVFNGYSSLNSSRAGSQSNSRAQSQQNSKNSSMQNTPKQTPSKKNVSGMQQFLAQ